MFPSPRNPCTNEGGGQLEGRGQVKLQVVADPWPPPPMLSGQEGRPHSSPPLPVGEEGGWQVDGGWLDQDQIWTRLSPSREGSRLNREGSRLNREGSRLNREGSRLSREGSRLSRQGSRLQQGGEPTEQGGEPTEQGGEPTEQGGEPTTAGRGAHWAGRGADWAGRGADWHHQGNKHSWASASRSMPPASAFSNFLIPVPADSSWSSPSFWC